MKEDIICERIFELMLPYSQKETCPISYITVTAGRECSVDDNALVDAFTKRKWDSELQAADLLVVRKAEGDEPNTSLFLTSYSRFEVDGVPDGDRLKDGPIQIGSYS